MVVGQYDVRLNGDRMPILTQTNTYSLGEEVTITSPDVLVKVLNQFFVNASLLCSREVFLRLLLCGASGMILVHNHPSGSVAASKDDFSVFKKLVMASEMMGIQFLDFIIIGKGYCSFKEYGYFEK